MVVDFQGCVSITLKIFINEGPIYFFRQKQEYLSQKPQRYVYYHVSNTLNR